MDLPSHLAIRSISKFHESEAVRFETDSAAAEVKLLDGQVLEPGSSTTTRTREPGMDVIDFPIRRNPMRGSHSSDTA